MDNTADWGPNFTSWGRNINATTGQPGTATIQCRTYQAAARQCLIDSVTSYNPWTAPSRRG